MACTVSGYILLRCAVMMWRALKALKCLSHSADEAGITNTRLAISAVTTVDTCEHADPTNVADQNHQEQQLESLLGRSL